jgi:hypothetical protein
MRGLLKKKDGKYQVDYYTTHLVGDFGIKALPIHPKDIPLIETEYNNDCLNNNINPVIDFNIEEVLEPGTTNYYEVASVFQEKVDISWEDIYARYKRNGGKKSFYNWIKINYITPNKK